jgi:cysteine desulfurase
MIYLDNAATTQPITFAENDNSAFFANPSSPHGLGIMAERALSDARQILSEILHCKPKELIFTSGGTEANNLTVIGYASALAKKDKATIFAEPWAHPSVLSPINYTVEQGLATAQIAPKSAWVIPTAGAVLACLSHVNHETGDITNIAEIANHIKKTNPATVIFTDGAQGFCKDLNQTQAFTASDIYTFSGHKCHAPTGVGGLVVRGDIKIHPLFYGGGQENKLRPGTENVASIVHMTHAVQFLNERFEENYAHVIRLRDSLAEVIDEIPDSTVNVMSADYNVCNDVAGKNIFYKSDRFIYHSPFILNMSFYGTRGEVLVHMLSEKGICVSMGAACKSRNKRDKSALVVMGFFRETAEAALRFSFSHFNTLEEIEETKKVLITCVNQLRKISGYKIGRK